MQFNVEKVHIESIRIGDTVLINNELMTVGKNNLKRDVFNGLALCGDSYNLGTRPVLRAVIKRALPVKNN